MLSEPLLAGYCAFGVISLSLYGCMIFAILSGPLRRNSIYQLMVLLGTADVTGYFVNAFLFRFSLCPRFFDFFTSIGSPFWLRILIFLAYFVGYAQYLIHFTICVNRLTAVLMLTAYDRTWSKLFPFVVAGTMFLAAIPSYHHFFAEVSFAPLFSPDPSLGYAAAPEQSTKMNNTVFMLYVVPIFAVSCLLVNITTLALIIRYKRQSTGIGVERRPELSLFIIACVMVLMQCFNGSYHFVSYYIATNKLYEYFPTLLWHFPWINDVNNLNAPWVALIASRSLRDAMLRRKHKVGVATPLASPTVGSFPAFHTSAALPVVT